MRIISLHACAPAVNFSEGGKTTYMYIKSYPFLRRVEDAAVWTLEPIFRVGIGNVNDEGDNCGGILDENSIIKLPVKSSA